MNRPDSEAAQVDSGPNIIRVKESGGYIYRMKWNGSAYAITTEKVQVYEDSGTTPLTLDAGKERLAFWRPAAGRYEVCDGGEVPNFECGLTVVSGTVKIDPSIAGANLTWDAENCRLNATGELSELSAGCGVTIVSNVVAFDAAAVAGPGLEYEGCALGVNVGCGLEIVDDTVAVNLEDIAGAGLIIDAASGGSEDPGCDVLSIYYNCSLDIPISGADTGKLRINPEFPTAAQSGLAWVDAGTHCQIKVLTNCSLEIPAEGTDVGKLRVADDFPDDEAGAIEWVDEATKCQIKVKHNCSLVINDDGELAVNDAIAGDFLNANVEDCRLDVQNVLTSWITEITGFAIVGDKLVLQYQRVFGRVLQVGTQLVEKYEVPLIDPCATE